MKATRAFGGSTVLCLRASSAIASIRCCRAAGIVPAIVGSVLCRWAPGARLYRARLEFACELAGALREPREHAIERRPLAGREHLDQCLLVLQREWRNPAVHGGALRGDLQHRPATIGARLSAAQPPVTQQARDSTAHRDRVHLRALGHFACRQTRVAGQDGQDAPFRDTEVEALPVSHGDRRAHDVRKDRQTVRKEALEAYGGGGHGRYPAAMLAIVINQPLCGLAR